jgi:molecular chaperone DnaJ
MYVFFFSSLSRKTCRGSGQQISQQGFFAFAQPCRTCSGEGSTVSDPCPSCRGEGVVKEVRMSLRIRINENEKMK